MAVPQSKTELLSAIEVNFDKLMTDLRAIPLDLADDCGLDGHAAGTRMSIANLVSYLIGWNELVLKWLDRDKAGLAVDFPETGFKWSELGRLAQKFYRDYEALPYPALLQRLEAAKERIVSEIESRSDDTKPFGRHLVRARLARREMDHGADDPVQHVLSLRQCARPAQKAAQSETGLGGRRLTGGSRTALPSPTTPG
nr:ClbS/DfsB family four-helix bundle protein [Brevundimonas diminuta]